MVSPCRGAYLSRIAFKSVASVSNAASEVKVSKSSQSYRQSLEKGRTEGLECGCPAASCTTSLIDLHATYRLHGGPSDSTRQVPISRSPALSSTDDSLVVADWAHAAA